LRGCGTTVFDLRDVFDIDWTTVDQLDHRVADLPDMLWHGIGVNIGVESRRNELARGQKCVGLSDGGGDFFCRDSARLRLGAMYDDVDLPLPPTIGRRACNPGNALQQRFNIVERVVIE
jgi:hypothetical protein